MAGIYIHIPFCEFKCMYCDFYSISDKETLIPEFVKALILEIERCQVETQDLEIETIFIGGGTPSLLKSKYIDLIVNALHKKHKIETISYKNKYRVNEFLYIIPNFEYILHL